MTIHERAVEETRNTIEQIEAAMKADPDVSWKQSLTAHRYILALLERVSTAH